MATCPHWASPEAPWGQSQARQGHLGLLLGAHHAKCLPVDLPGPRPPLGQLSAHVGFSRVPASARLRETHPCRRLTPAGGRCSWFHFQRKRHTANGLLKGGLSATRGTCPRPCGQDPASKTPFDFVPLPPHHLVSGRKRSSQTEREGKLIILTNHCNNRKNQKVLQNDSVSCVFIRSVLGGSTLHLDVGLYWRASSRPSPPAPPLAAGVPQGLYMWSQVQLDRTLCPLWHGSVCDPTPTEASFETVPCLCTLTLDQETGAFQSGVD